MREPKPETVIRNLRSRAKRDYQERLTLISERDSYRRRATVSEQDAADWKRRFDTLLRCLSQEVRDRMAKEPGIFGGAV